MQRLIFVVVLTMTLFNYSYSQNIFEEFKNKFQQDYVHPFNKDLTGIICSNIFNHADDLGLFRAVPLSIGMNIKISCSAKKISDDNKILKDTFKDFGYVPFIALQFEKGLPYNIDILGRYSGYENFTFWSAGVKYKIISLPPIASIASIAIAGVYNKLDAKDILEHTSQSYNLIVSVDKIPVIQPYIVFGMDKSEMKVSEKLIVGGLSDTFSSEPRYEVGVNISTLPFLYFTVGYSYIYNTDGFSLNLGLKF